MSEDKTKGPFGAEAAAEATKRQPAEAQLATSSEQRKVRSPVTLGTPVEPTVTMTQSQLAAMLDEAVQRKVARVAEVSGMRLPLDWKAKVDEASKLPTMEVAQATAQRQADLGLMVDPILTDQGWHVHHWASIPIHQRHGAG